MTPSQKTIEARKRLVRLLNETVLISNDLDAIMFDLSDYDNAIKEREKEAAVECLEYVKDNRWQSMPEESWMKRYSDRPTELKSSKELCSKFLEEKYNQKKSEG